MEVKSIYLDLQKAELNKRGKKTVWKLESEAFKEPLELKIGYDDKELEQFNGKIELLELELKNQAVIKDWLKQQIDNAANERKSIIDRIKEHEGNMEKLNEKIENQNKEISQLYKVIADAKTMIETQSGTILKLQDKVKELEKKVTKQPMVFHDKCFISWRESSGIWVFDLPDGEYLMIAKCVIWECNEYVENYNDIVFEKIHVEWQHYVPFYKLEWGTELDTPTATIYYDLVFIPV